MRVTVVWANGQLQFEQPLELPQGSDIQAAIASMRLQLTNEHLPDWDQAAVGVFGELRERSAILHEGDRVEIYRPLLIDPKEGRRARAARLRR